MTCLRYPDTDPYYPGHVIHLRGDEDPHEFVRAMPRAVEFIECDCRAAQRDSRVTEGAETGQPEYNGASVKPYYADAHVTLHHGDALDVLRALPDQSVDCAVTSPPYFGLRDYGVDGQYGLEPSPAEYVERMREVFAEVRRVLADDGTLWLNIGDSYASSGGTSGVGPNATVGSTLNQDETRTRPSSALPSKNLMGIPWRVAFALQDDGWILRNDIVWAKPNGMPESVRDRLSSKHEYVFMFSKRARYWFDLDVIKVPSTGEAPGNRPEAVAAYVAATGTSRGERRWGGNESSTLLEVHETRNPGDVWTIPTQPFAAAHFAVMAPTLAKRCVLAGCKPGGTVLDPFSGSGTTGLVAVQAGRKYVGIELSREYLDLSLRTRFAQPALDFGEGA